mmetsp:Transcript_78647/g.172409  ORF Transcript_78647/g.172409 Transcript_78647/m.172409 type:complete len:96 (-) Transcript_78647:1068-1355(-)
MNRLSEFEMLGGEPPVHRRQKAGSGNGAKGQKKHPASVRLMTRSSPDLLASWQARPEKRGKEVEQQQQQQQHRRQEGKKARTRRRSQEQAAQLGT